ncbi:MAG: acylphosphatase [Bacteroidota bacterium]
MKHYNITITGKVQGVFFRKYTVEQALKLNVNGVVRNEANGDVYCEVEGEEDVLKQFAKWCWKGSPFSKVEKVSITEGVMQHFQLFEIKR